VSRDPLLYLEDILQAAEWIGEYVAGTDFDDLVSDHMRFNAVVRALEVIGEAARGLPEDIRRELPGVPWREIIGMRNVLVHAYFAVDPDVVWSAATEQVPPLAVAVARRLAEETAASPQPMAEGRSAVSRSESRAQIGFTTPRELAAELGVSDTTVRSKLREWYVHPAHGRWELTPDMVARVRRHFGRR
jgi:uncharacterized protein with HEPN domain